MKRPREDGEGPSSEASAKAEAEPAPAAPSDSDEEPVQADPAGARVRSGAECPYLDSINRQVLDFDFEKCCSVSLVHTNVYACLVCGKYFAGRGRNTHAFTHCLDTSHHLFMKVADGRVYCLPDNYEVLDKSLKDIQYLRDPTYTPDEIARLDAQPCWSKALDGTDYMPGLVGLNNMRHNDYANVVLQVLARVPPVRDFFLDPDNYSAARRGGSSPLVARLGELMRKVWHRRMFKGQVSPHEFMQAVIAGSDKRFTIEEQSDPLDFTVWLLNQVHVALTGGRRKASSIITRCFAGELEITTLAGTGSANSKTDVTKKVPFFVLSLDLPPTPLFQDAMERNAIPQVPVFSMLSKYDGVTVHDDIKAGRRQYRVTKLPRFLVLAMKRFKKNNFFIEKNPTIVNFPVKGLDLAGTIPVPEGAGGAPEEARYDLIANICHEGKANEGTYRVHVHRQMEDCWHEVQDLRIVDVLPQMVALSETYMQVYQRRQ